MRKLTEWNEYQFDRYLATSRDVSPRKYQHLPMELPGSIFTFKVNVEAEEERGLLNHQYPPQLLAMAPALRVPLAPGDTIEFDGTSSHDSIFKSYHGRILHVVVDPKFVVGGESIPMHPNANHSEGGPIALIQIALTKEQSQSLDSNAVW